MALALAVFASVTFAGLQSRPPGLDLTGPRLVEIDAAVSEAVRAIDANRLTKPGRHGEPPAQDLLQQVLTADPDHAEALAAMARLIGALSDWGAGFLERSPPDLDGARTYWRKARDLAVAHRVEASTGRLDALSKRIRQRELARAERAVRAEFEASAQHKRTALKHAMEAECAASKRRELAALKRVMEEKLAAAEQAQACPRPEPVQVKIEVPQPSVQPARIRLRSEPHILSEAKAKAMLRTRGLYDRDWNPQGQGIANVFVDGGDGTVSDRATGLMWQQRGSFQLLSLTNALVYVNGLNARRFAGYADWRLPTLEEASSLLEREALNDIMHISSIFDWTQRWIWTADGKEGSAAMWYILFDGGYVNWYGNSGQNYVRACRSIRP